MQNVFALQNEEHRERGRRERERNNNHRVIVSFCRFEISMLVLLVYVVPETERQERRRRDEQCPQRCTGNKNRRVRVDHCHLVSPPFHLILFTPRGGPDVRSAAARLSSKLLRQKKNIIHKGRDIFA